MGMAKALYSFSKEFNCSLVITALRNDTFHDVPLVIHSPSGTLRLAVDRLKHRVRMSLPV
jgi:hypothetical protein